MSNPNTTIAQTLPMRYASGNGISVRGCASPLRKSTSEQLVAWREKTAKLTPPGTMVAPNGYGRPTRNQSASWRWVG